MSFASRCDSHQRCTVLGMGFLRAWGSARNLFITDYEAVDEASEEGYAAGFAAAQNLYEDDSDEDEDETD